LREATVEILAGTCRELCRPDISAGRASSEAYRVTMALHDDLMSRIDTGPGSPGAHLAIDRAAAYARAHLEAPLDVASLAAVAGLSRAHFVRLFRRFEGVAPSEFVLRERMNRATRLLVKGQLSIKEIADACGFEDPNYFAKVFRRTYAISPSEFRTTGMYSTKL
jgi:transcriptional regulator GlxA family with amidase domain